MKKVIFLFLSGSFTCFAAAAQTAAAVQPASAIKDIRPSQGVAAAEAQKEAVTVTTADKAIPQEQMPAPAAPSAIPMNAPASMASPSKIDPPRY